MGRSAVIGPRLGKVKGSTASGKVRVRETFTSPSGQKVATCTSPNESFSTTRH
jgi:hypothetical protein